MRNSSEHQLSQLLASLTAEEIHCADTFRTATVELEFRRTELERSIRARNECQESVVSLRQALQSTERFRPIDSSDEDLPHFADEARAKLIELANSLDECERLVIRQKQRRREMQSEVKLSELDSEQLESTIQQMSDDAAKLDAQIGRICDTHGFRPQRLMDEVEQLERDINEARGNAVAKEFSRDAILARVSEVNLLRDSAVEASAEARANMENSQAHLRELFREFEQFSLEEPFDDDVASNKLDLLRGKAGILRSVLSQGRVIAEALGTQETRLKIFEKQRDVEQLRSRIEVVKAEIAKARSGIEGCTSVERLLAEKRKDAIAGHIAAYGPVITNIQQRLRSVYGFGGVHLEARDGEAVVQVEWRKKAAHVRPTDFFSDSQKQILMLSIFLAGGLRQSWSGFAPVLLDDPVTHFDDLNAFGFVELLRGIVCSRPDAWQFFVSTCEERLFALMQRKFARLPGGVICYEFLGMSDDGPIVEQR
jgi:hypothetical protein